MIFYHVIQLLGVFGIDKVFAVLKFGLVVFQTPSLTGVVHVGAGSHNEEDPRHNRAGSEEGLGGAGAQHQGH